MKYCQVIHFLNYTFILYMYSVNEASYCVQSYKDENVCTIQWNIQNENLYKFNQI